MSLITAEVPIEQTNTLTDSAQSRTNNRIVEEVSNEMDNARVDYLREKLRRAIVAKIKREGWSQSEAGQRCETSRIHMNHLVRGKGSAALSKMIQVAEGLGLRIDLIIEDRSGNKK